MPNDTYLAKTRKEEHLRRIASMTRTEIVNELMTICINEYEERSKDELVRLLTDFTRRGTQGYEEWPIEMLRTELIKTPRGGGQMSEPRETPAGVKAVLDKAKDPYYYHRGWDRVHECCGAAGVEEELREENIDPGDSIASIAHYIWLVNLWREQADNVMCQSGEHEKRPCGNWVPIGKKCDCERIR